MSDKPKDEKKKGGDKPKGDKPAGDKAKGDKPAGDKAKGDKPAGDKAKGGDKKGKGDDKKGDGKKDGGEKKGKGDDKKGDKKGDDKKGGDKKGDGEKKDKKPAAEAAAKSTDGGDAAPKADAGADDAKDSAAAAADGAGDEKKVVANAPLDPQSALQQVLLTSLHNDGLARGLHESVKALDRREAHLCVLSSGCNEPAYVKLITALCSEHQIPLIKVEDSKQLGEWVGLCKRNSEQKAVKVVGCSCAVIRSWGEETEARQYIMNHIKQN